MPLALYIVSVLIILHAGLAIFGYAKMERFPDQRFRSILVHGILILAVMVSLLAQNWQGVAVSFAIFLILMSIRPIFSAIRRRRRATLLVPVNFVMVAASAMAVVLRVWWIFLIAYPLHWGMTLLTAQMKLGRKRGMG